MRRFIPAFLLLAASCSKEETTDITVAKQKIWENVKKYYQGYDKGDLDVMESLLTADCSFKKPTEIVQGKDKVGEALKGAVAESKKIDPEGKRQTLVGSETINVLRDTAIVTLVANANYPKATFKGLVTMIFRRQDGQWMIAHIHESW